MIIISFRRLNDEQIKQIQQLYTLCRDAESLRIAPAFSGDDEDEVFWYYLLYNDKQALLSCISLYELAPGNFELAAYTHPDHRRKGYFKCLYQAFLSDYKGEEAPVSEISLDGQSADADACIKHINGEYLNTEYMMSLTIYNIDAADNQNMRIVKNNDIENYAELHSEAFDEPLDSTREFIYHTSTAPDTIRYMAYDGDTVVGGFHLTEYEYNWYLFGFFVRPQFRNKGYGRKMLKALSQRPGTVGKNLCLQVSGNNIKAFSLYQTFGFRITDRRDFYRINL